MNKFLYVIILVLGVFITAVAQPGGGGSANPFKSNPIQNPFTDNKKAITKPSQFSKAFSNNPQKEVNKDGNGDVIPSSENKNKKKTTPLDMTDKNNEGTEELEISEPTTSATISAEQPTTEKIYGMDFFNPVEKGGASFESNVYATIPPANYKIGAGDEIVVSVYGTSEVQGEYVVNRDGSIMPGALGKIYIGGMAFENAQRVIKSRFKSVIAQGSNVDVQMGKVRTIKVTLIGEIMQPGTITVSAFTSVINAIAYAQGVTSLGNLRNIELKRNGQVIAAIDLYEFIKNANSLEDQFLEDGDIISIGNYEKLVKAEGRFKRPMFYQLKGNEDINNLIELAGGPNYDARFSSVQIKSIFNEQVKLLTINLKELNAANSSLMLYDGDVVSLKKVNTQFSNTVIVEGAVNYPDEYEILENEKLTDLIKKAGGLLSDAYTYRAYLYRGSDKSLSQVGKIDLVALYNGDQTQNLEILPGDRISIISKKDFEKSYSVEIVGLVNRPISLNYASNLKLKDLLIAAGGITNSAESGRIEIASILDSATNYGLKLKDKATWRTISINPDLTLDEASEEILLKPYDKVYVRQQLDFHLIKKVYVAGEVKYGGEYPLLNKKEKISDIIEMCGGLKYDAADIKGAIFSRIGKGRIGINLEEIIRDKNSTNNLLLVDGDSLFIPKAEELVQVTGEVIKQISIIGNKNNTSLLYYISGSGGFGDKSWKNRVSVTYPNGKTKTTKNFLGIRVYPKVYPGCSINVPQKIDEEKKIFNIADITTIVASAATTLGTLVTTYLIISKL